MVRGVTTASYAARRIPPWLALALKVVLAAGLTVAGLESLLRLTGYGVWQDHRLPAREPVMHEPDPVRGWRNKVGTFTYPGYTPGASPITTTVGPDGARATAARDEPHPGGTVVMVGDSFTRGWAVSDDETFAWQLAARFPAVEFRNYGTAGYGTYQSLLALDEVLSHAGRPPRLVLYGFTDWQGIRNVAPPPWLLILTLASHQQQVSAPYCTIAADGTLLRHPPEQYPMWPLKRYSAAITALEFAWAQHVSALRLPQTRPVTELLLREMQALSRRHGAELVVVSLAAGSEYVSDMKSQGIHVVDCGRSLDTSSTVPGEGHPNATTHAFWGGCIGDALVRDRLLTDQGR